MARAPGGGGPSPNAHGGRGRRPSRLRMGAGNQGRLRPRPLARRDDRAARLVAGTHRDPPADRGGRPRRIPALLPADGCGRRPTDAWLLDRDVELVALAGNHDPPRRPLRLTSVVVDGWTIAHGDKAIEASKTITGHLHPVLRAEGVSAPCFLVGPSPDRAAGLLGQRRGGAGGDAWIEIGDDDEPLRAASPRPEPSCWTSDRSRTWSGRSDSLSERTGTFTTSRRPVPIRSRGPVRRIQRFLKGLPGDRLFQEAVHSRLGDPSVVFQGHVAGEGEDGDVLEPRVGSAGRAWPRCRPCLACSRPSGRPGDEARRATGRGLPHRRRLRGRGSPSA